MLLTVCCAKSAGFQSETKGLCWGSCGSLRTSRVHPVSRIDEGMTSYAEMARERKRARSLYLELRALGLELYAKEDSGDATGYRVRVAGLHSLPETHAERIRRRVEASKPGLLRVLFGRWDADILAIQQEGAMK